MSYIILGIVIFVVILVIVIIVILIVNNDEPIIIKKIPEKIEKSIIENNIEIPYLVFQSWNTYDISQNMYDTIMENVKMNPEFDFMFYDDEKCREFLIEHFDENVVKTFDSLKPGAYKSDLWRLCALYIHGGVYMDIKFKTDIPLKELTKMNQTIFVKDLNDFSEDSVYQGFIIAKPKDEIIKKSIDKIVENVNKKFYGNNYLEITGPTMIGPIIKSISPESIKMKLDVNQKENIHRIKFIDKDINILEQYPKYRLDQRKNGSKHYSVLWNEKDVYN